MAGVVLAGYSPGAVKALRSGEGHRLSPGVHDTQLPVLAILVSADEGRDGLLGGLALGHQVEAARAVVEVGERLRGESPYAGECSRDDRSDGNELELEGDV